MNEFLDIVKHVAQLSRLRISEASEDVFAKQFEDVLGYMDQLSELDEQYDMSSIPETNQVTGLTNVYREDKRVDYPADKRAKLFREAPEMRDGYIVVPRVVEN